MIPALVVHDRGLVPGRRGRCGGLRVLMLAARSVLMVAVLFIGVEVKGSQRWISLAGLSIQPSEFMKPAFVIICAWLFAEQARQPEIPGNLFAIILFGLVAALLVAQPDLGQTMLIAGTWGAMFFMAGMPWLWIVLLGGVGDRRRVCAPIRCSRMWRCASTSS